MLVIQFLSIDLPGSYCDSPKSGAIPMTDIKNQPRYQGLDRRAPRVAADVPAEARDRSGVVVKRPEKVGGRHGAITTSLYSWHSYKNWADKMRGNFDDKKD
jgi:hypothetical protein